MLHKHYGKMTAFIIRDWYCIQMKRKTLVVLQFTIKDLILEYIVRSNYS